MSDMIKYSVDALLKERPEQLKGLEIVKEEDENGYIDINKVTVFADYYEIVYGESYVILRFYNENDELVASTSAFGSNEHKKDECFFVEFNSIISETELRRLNDIFNEAIE